MSLEAKGRQADQAIDAAKNAVAETTEAIGDNAKKLHDNLDRSASRAKDSFALAKRVFGTAIKETAVEAGKAVKQTAEVAGASIQDSFKNSEKHAAERRAAIKQVANDAGKAAVDTGKAVATATVEKAGKVKQAAVETADAAQKNVKAAAEIVAAIPGKVGEKAGETLAKLEENSAVAQGYKKEKAKHAPAVTETVAAVPEGKNLSSQVTNLKGIKSVDAFQRSQFESVLANANPAQAEAILKATDGNGKLNLAKLQKNVGAKPDSVLGAETNGKLQALKSVTASA